jgi:tRNA G18 (ribose-2'-O)-methylase SpoU
VADASVGRPVRCEACGRDFTARPRELWSILERREAKLRRGDPRGALGARERSAEPQRRWLDHPPPEGDPRGATLARDAAYEASVDRRERAEPAVDIVGVLDDVRSQWNVGAIFRTAEAAGFAGLTLAGITPSPPAAGVLKTALGAEEMLPWTYRASVVEALQDAGRELVALELTPDSTSVFDFEPPKKLALVAGNEVAGVSAEARALCPRRIHIPMAGRKGSLNVAVAFGVAAFALARAWRRAHV